MKSKYVKMLITSIKRVCEISKRPSGAKLRLLFQIKGEVKEKTEADLGRSLWTHIMAQDSCRTLCLRVATHWGNSGHLPQKFPMKFII